ncbi:MAG: hypothetical protein MUF84_16195 [Anaerolineae bacterium]|nr:hypothetical protein [Anaerolineae bacterium]
MNNNTLSADYKRLSVIEKQTDPKLVAYTRFRGVLNAPSRMWMVRDWAKRSGCSLIGPPQCVFYAGETDPERRLCEIQWQIAEGWVSAEGEISSKRLSSTTVIAAYHQERPLTIRNTELALAAWAKAHGYRLTGTCCEVYHPDAEGQSEHWITEIQLFTDGACPTYGLFEGSTIFRGDVGHAQVDALLGEGAVETQSL